MKQIALVVPEDDRGQRIDRFIAFRGGITRGLARRALDAGGVFLEGKRCKVAGRTLWPGQRVVVNLEEGGRVPEAPLPLDPSRILYADSDVVVVDKPAGVPSQPTLTTERGTLPELVKALLGEPVFLVHRLDRETSGAMILARTKVASSNLAEAFRAGKPAKTYLALVSRPPNPAEGLIDAPLGKDPTRAGLRRIDIARGDPAATRYRTLRAGPLAALLEASPLSGRTHQIRVHFAHIGAPLLGDPRYGGARRVGEVAVPRVMLHALRLELVHPATSAKMVFEAPVPEDFRAIESTLVG